PVCRRFPTKGHHFDWHGGPRPQLIHELFVVGNDDEACTYRGDDLLPQQRTPKAFDQVQRPELDLIGAVYCEVQPAVFGKRRQWDPAIARLRGTTFGSWNGTDPEAATHSADQRLDGIMGGRSGAETNHHPIVNHCGCSLRGGALLLVAF